MVSDFPTLDTPVLLVDVTKLQANISRFATMAQQAGVALRPHIKTHKTVEIARLQLAAGAQGITTAKLSEAEVFAEAGITDIFVAYPIVGPLKAERAARLAQKIQLMVGAESETGLKMLSETATRAGSTIAVRLEVNSGLNRSGTAPEKLLELARLAIKLPGLKLDGIFTFRGASFPGAPSKDPFELGKLEGTLMVQLANDLRNQGIPIHSVSVGSTPTSEGAATIPGVTEIRPGTYAFFDRMTTQAGTSSLDEIALSVLTTVVSRPSEQMAIIDAGSKVFSGDVIPERIGLDGYGVTIDGSQGVVVQMSEEHAFVRLAPGFQPQVGDRLFFFPNHVCTSVNLSLELITVQDEAVKESWQIAARGLRY